MKAARIAVEGNIEETILDFLKKAMDKKLFDAILIPMAVPAGDSYAWVLTRDKLLLDEASSFPPIMSVQGAKAISSLTKRGKTNKKIAALMRPCEIRATIELSKLHQVELDNIFLISLDCPGVLPLKDWIKDPKRGADIFKEVMQHFVGGDLTSNKSVRPACTICHRFSDNGAADLHIGILGTKGEEIFFIPHSTQAEGILAALDLSLGDDLSGWQNSVDGIMEERKKKRAQVQEELKTKVVGLDHLLDAFDNCIGCHICQRVCPICFCRQCYFDSDKVKHPSDDYLMRAESKGSISILPDKIIFHLGRMSHMALSCVGCGACEDACPMSIKVAQIFSLIADRSQDLFSYIAGKSLEEPLPLRTYEEDELQVVETP